MNTLDHSMPVARARLDREGRLIEADARIDALNARAGGRIGAPLAIPQIATLARLAMRLGIAVSRAVVAADGEDDLDLWARIDPDEHGAAVTLGGWRHRPAWPAVAAAAERDTDLLSLRGDFRVETDAALRLTAVPAEAGERYGFNAVALLGQPITRLFIFGQGEEGSMSILGAAAKHVPFTGQPARLRDSGRLVRIDGTPRTDAAGRFAGYLAAVTVEESDTDVTSLLGGGSDMLDAFNERLDRALRRPLSRIIANADSISAQSEGPLRQDYADYAADIANAGRHLLGLVDELADLHAVERPDFSVETEVIDLADVARRAAGLLSVRAADGEVRIDRPAPEDRLLGRGEFRRALQILVNLIGNAVRYSPRGGNVWLRLERDAGHVCVIVADQGKGIAPEDQERIFEKFGRIDPTEPGGAGLGLYIARRLARAMGGDITVDSAPGQGARFTFCLPAAE